MKQKDEFNDLPDLMKSMEDFLKSMDIKKLSAKDEAIMNDQKLSDLALYACTNGLTKVCNDPEAIQNRFTEFKRLVKRGSFTIEQLENSVGERYGIVNKVI